MTHPFTPGPWEWDAGIIPPDGPGRYAEIYIIGDDREPIILADFNDNLPEGRSNARLIASAPDLLAALDFMINVSRATPGFSAMARQQAEAAIAKATGQQVAR